MGTGFKEKLQDERPYWKVVVSLAFSLIGTVLFVYVGFRMILFFMPFVIGWVIAYIAHPMVNWLEKRMRIVKKLGSMLIIVGVLAAVGFCIYLIVSRLWHEIAGVIQNMPEMYEDLELGLSEIGDSTKGLFEMLPEGVQKVLDQAVSNLNQTAGDIIGRISEPTVTAAGNLAMRIPSALIAVIVTFISAYFFIADQEEVVAWVKRVTPDSIASRMGMVSDNLKYAVGGYFKAQFKIMAVVFTILLLGFVVLHIHFSFLLAIIIAFLDFLPFFGTGTALLPWAFYKFMVGDYKMTAGLIILYGVTQLVRQLIQPKLVGDSMGMKPLVTLFLLYVGYKAGGVFGMIFAVPIGMIVINLYKAGAFDYILDDVKILTEGVLSLRNRS